MSATTIAPVMHGPATVVRLVPVRDRRPASRASERRGAGHRTDPGPLRRVGAPRGGLRLTRRGRVVVWALGAALAAGVGGAAAAAHADGPPTAMEVRRVVVAPGQTLWGVAAGVADPGEDVRDVVVQLMELNRLDSAGLQAGQQIIVPVG